MNGKKLLCAVLTSALAVSLMAGCSTSPSASSTSPSAPQASAPQTSADAGAERTPEKTQLKVGTFASSGIAAEAGVSTLEEMGYEVEVIYFDDAVLPNTALQEGSIDYNIYQHTPYLEAYLQDNSGTSLSMAELLYYPMYGLYSTRYTSLDEIPDGAHIGLYSDASNVDRGLRLLDACGLITLVDEEKELYSELDVVENPKNLTFELVSFGSAVRALEDLDACMAAGSHILDGGMDPTAALALEERGSTGSDFTCGIAVRTEDMDTVWLEDVITAYTSDASRDYMNENYKGASVPVF